jgi:uncharacterized protein (DUF2141 family)
MDYISNFRAGYGRRSWTRARLVTMLVVLPLQTAASTTASLDVHVIGLRSTKGIVRACLTAVPRNFPDCNKDPAAYHISVYADQANDIRFDDVAAGAYAVSLFHDQNENGRLDTFLAVPTEGFGFSNNPVVRFGPPSFAQAQIMITGSAVTTVRVRYLF